MIGLLPGWVTRRGRFVRGSRLSGASELVPSLGIDAVIEIGSPLVLLLIEPNPCVSCRTTILPILR